MKKIQSVLVALLVMVWFSGTAAAAQFDLGQLVVSEGGGPFGNGTFDQTDPDYIPLAATDPFQDEWLFTVDVPASFASSTTTITVQASSVFTSFNTALYVFEDGWQQLVSNVGTAFSLPDTSSGWLSVLNYSPLSADPTQYKLAVFGAKSEGVGSYSGVISVSPVTPVPEPEIYAMMAAGLGLMGFVARRRQKNGVVT